MNINFAPLAMVAITHGYYSSGCRDIEFVTTSRTRELLRAGRMLARMQNGQLLVLYEADTPGVPISNLAGETLYFGLRLTNASFANVTAPVIADGALTPLFTNTVAPGALDAVRGVSLLAGLYQHAPELATRPVTLQLKDLTSNTLDSRVLGDALTSYDLRGLPPGEYRIEEDYGGGVQRTRNVLIDADLRDAGVWGVLALRIDTAFYANAATLTLSFDARAEFLRYYVVVRNWTPADFNLLTVVDDGAIAAGRAPILFNKNLSPLPADFIQESLLGDSSTQIVVFQSQTEVARQERGLRKLNLSHSTTVLIEHLPLPGPERAKADLIVHLSKP